MAERKFSLEYQGPALEAGRIDVRDLAPALLSLADLFREVNQIAVPGAPPVSVDIEATERSSFDVNLILHSVDSLIDGVDHLMKLYVLLFGGAGVGLFEFIRRRGRRRIVERTPPTDDGQVTVRLSDGEQLTVSEKVLQAHDSPGVQRNAKRVVQPLRADGIDWLQVESEDVRIRVFRDEAPSFEVIEGQEGREVSSTEREMYLTIPRPDFVPGNKWHVYDGANYIWVAIEDATFINDVAERRIGFFAGDKIRATVQTRQFLMDDGDLRIEHAITEVLEVLPQATQGQLDV